MLQSYEVVEHMEDGRIYVVVTLTSGATFGQIINPGTQKQMDAQVAEAVERYEAQATPPELPKIGAVRTANAITSDGIKLGVEI